MSTASLNITDSEFQREVEALMSHRRLSVNRPILDPDLPDLAAIRGGGQELLTGSSSEREARGFDLIDQGAVPLKTDGSSLLADTHNEREQFSARRRGKGSLHSNSSDPSDSSETLIGSGSLAESLKSASAGSSATTHDPARPQDPSHLFWVPASVHPEISPADFRKFLKDHANRAVTQLAMQEQASSHEGAEASSQVSSLVSRINSIRLSGEAPADLISRSTSLSRRHSMLRTQYRPENDPDDDDDSSNNHNHKSEKLPLQRNRSNLGRSRNHSVPVPSLTIDDLQKLEQLAEEASQSQDPTRLRSALRRTLSLNVSPLALDQVDNVPQDTDEGDAPIIVPRPGQILRRAARTKIRKSSMSSDGSRGFGQRRRVTGPNESDMASESHHRRLSDFSDGPQTMERRQSNQSEFSSGGEDESFIAASLRPDSEVVTESIVDAYSRDSYHSDLSQTPSITSLTETASEASAIVSDQLRSESPSPPITPTQASVITTAPQIGFFDGNPSRTASQGQADASLVGHVARAIEPSLLATSSASITSNSVVTSPTLDQTGSSRVDAPLHTSNQIKPIPVSHIPPVPSFEKTRPKKQQQPQPQQQQPKQHHHQPPLSPTPPPPPPNASLKHSATAAATPPALYPGFKSDGSSHSSASPSVMSVKSRPVSPPPQRKEKERKGGFGLSWFGLGKDEDDDRDKASKAEREKERKREKHERRERKEREREREEEKEREKDSSSFLGALFGKKKGHDDSLSHSSSRTPSGHITAGSLLDRSDGAYGKGALNYYRYPIHVERAVYRLSHIKLANPRRPLYEQVLISNLMFWYLSIINRSQQQQQQQQQQQAAQKSQLQQSQPQQPISTQPTSPSTASQTSLANSQQPAAAQEPTLTSSTSTNASSSSGSRSSTSSPKSSSSKTITSPILGMAVSSNSELSDLSSVISDGNNIMASFDTPSDLAERPNSSGTANGHVKSKRGGLVKPNRAPAGSGRTRSAEIPMKQPSYPMQHRQIDDDIKTITSPTFGNVSSLSSGETNPLATGFSVGQVVDTKAMQANPPPHRAASEGDIRHGTAGPMAITTDYLGMGANFASSPPLHSITGVDQVGVSGRGSGRDGDKENYKSATRHGRRSGSYSSPYRVEAEKERAWLGSSKSSTTSSRSATSSATAVSLRGHGHGKAMDTSEVGHRSKGSLEMAKTGKSDRGFETHHHHHHQSRSQSMSVGSASIEESLRRIEGWTSHGAPPKKASSSAMSLSASLGFHGSENGFGHDMLPRSASSHDWPCKSRRDKDELEVRNGQITLPILADTSAILEAARTSQSRRR